MDRAGRRAAARSARGSARPCPRGSVGEILERFAQALLGLVEQLQFFGRRLQPARAKRLRARHGGAVSSSRRCCRSSRARRVSASSCARRAPCAWCVAACAVSARRFCSACVQSCSKRSMRRARSDPRASAASRCSASTATSPSRPRGRLRAPARSSAGPSRERRARRRARPAAAARISENRLAGDSARGNLVGSRIAIVTARVSVAETAASRAKPAKRKRRARVIARRSSAIGHQAFRRCSPSTSPWRWSPCRGRGRTDRTHRRPCPSRNCSSRTSSPAL